MEFIGWGGSLLLSGSYILFSIEIIKSKNFYQTISGLGALLIIIYSYHISSYEAVVLNIVWLIISIIGALNYKIKFLFTSLSWFYNTLLSLLISSFVFYLYANIDLLDFLLSLFAYIGIYLYVSSYYLYGQKIISHQNFYVFNAIGALIYIPVLIVDLNFPVLVIEAMGLVFSLIGLKRLKISC